MRIAQIINNKIHWVTPYSSWDELPEFAPDVVFMEVPAEAEEGWLVNKDDTFSEPRQVESYTPVVTFQTVQARHFVSEILGIPFEISPEESYVLSREANLTPIPDGKEWYSGLNLAEGTIVKHNEEHFMVIQPHISQSDWSPDLVPALFEKVKESCAEWMQPAGVHDAYQTGDVVIWRDTYWESTHTNNVWNPGEFGWRELSM